MVVNRIRALRREAGYNQKELGECLGVGQTTVSAWEIGRNEPDNESSHKMAKLFGCSIGYLMGYEGESMHRGLSEREWTEFQVRKRQEREGEVYLSASEDELDPELQQTIEEHTRAEILQDWEENERSTFPEAVEINHLMENMTAEQREETLQIVRRVVKYAALK